MAKRLEWAKENVYIQTYRPGIANKEDRSYFSFFNSNVLPDLFVEGWRVPSKEEFETLISSNECFIGEFNDSKGIYVGELFFPSDGQIRNRKGENNSNYVTYLNQIGFYWTSTQSDFIDFTQYGYLFQFNITTNTHSISYPSTYPQDLCSLRLVREVEDECECSPTSFTDDELISEVKERGYKVFLEK